MKQSGITQDLLFDLTYACRMLGRNPGFTLVAVLSLALGIGANTTVFTIVNAALIERLPFRDADRLMVIWEIDQRNPAKANVVGPANYLRWIERNTSFQQMSAFYEWRTNLTGGGDPEEIVAQSVTANFFSTIGVDAMIGRTFAPDEGPVGHDQVTILGNAIWKSRFGGDPSVVGRAIQLDGRDYTVIGVMPPDTTLFLKAGSLVGKPAQIWTTRAYPEVMRTPRGRSISVVARLKPGVTPAAARVEMETLSSSLQSELPDFNRGWGVRVLALRDELSAEIRPSLLVLAGAVAFVLLIACANVANLLLVRGAARRREIAIRAALGAGRGRVLRQLLSESLLLAILGGAAGLIVARWSMSALLALSPIDLSGMGHIELSYSVLGFAMLVSLFAAVISGLIPAFEITRLDVQEALRDGGRQAGSGTRGRLLRQSFVVLQVAAAVVLLAGAGLMLKSFANMQAVNPGFDFQNVLTLRTTLPPGAGRPAAIQFYREAVENLQSIPGVEAAGTISFLPLTGTGTVAAGFDVEGQAPATPGAQPVVDLRVVDNGYFKVLKVPLRSGRMFTDREMDEKSGVVIVNESMAKVLGGNAVGKTIVIHTTNPPALNGSEIIGVVADSRFATVTTDSRPMAYWPVPQFPMTSMSFTVRTGSDPMAMAPLIRQTFLSMNKDLPVADVQTMDRYVTKSMAQTQFSSTLLTAFGGLALCLAAIGIYGVMSHAVSQRSAEIAVRMALGAERSEILRMIVGKGVVLVLIGIALGVPGAMILNQSLKAMLYNISGSDPVVFAAVALILATVAIIASYVPARRAARMSPVAALREQ